MILTLSPALTGGAFSRRDNTALFDGGGRVNRRWTWWRRLERRFGNGRCHGSVGILSRVERRAGWRLPRMQIDDEPSVVYQEQDAD
jgi:hypothetical protein